MATDNFDRANNADLGASWDASTSGLSSSGCQIVTNAVRATNLNQNGVETYNAVTFAANQFSEITISAWTGGNREAGVILRSSSPGTTTAYYAWAVVTAGVTRTRIGKMVAGVITDLYFATGEAWAAGDVFRAEVSGSTITVKRNGSVVTSVVDSAISNGRAGITVYAETNLADAIVDNWSGGDLSVSDPFPLLPGTFSPINTLLAM